MNNTKFYNILVIFFAVILATATLSHLLSIYFSLAFESLYLMSIHLVFLVVPLVLSISFQNKHHLKPKRCLTMIAIAGIGILSLYIYLDFNHKFRTRRGMEHDCQYFIGEVGKALLAYTERNGDFPGNAKWCDEVLSDSQSIKKRFFSLGQLQNNFCDMALNENLTEMSDITMETVLLIEATGPWNFAGGRELLNSKRDRNIYYPNRDRYIFVLFVDSTLAKYRLRDGSISFHESDKKSFSKWYRKGETLYSPLRWGGNN